MADYKLIKAIAKGLLTYFPGVANLLEKKKLTSTHSGSLAEFCYSLWLSLLVKIEENDIPPHFEKVGELGCGGSVGVGICAILTGTSQYFALEIENHYNRENNLKLLNEIVDLFKKKTPISANFKQLNIRLHDYSYPEQLITPKFLDNDLIVALRNDIKSDCINSKYINIIYNWPNQVPLRLDLVFSRAVMEHVNDPSEVYRAMTKYLNTGALTFHDIEFHSHNITNNRTGHLGINNALWKIIIGKRKYFLNRWKFNDHVHTLENLNFKIIHTQTTKEINNDSSLEVITGAIILSRLNS